MDAILDIAKVLSGLFAGWLLTYLNDWLKRKRDRKDDAAYLSASVLIILDRFLSGCANVALDDGTAYGRPAGLSESQEQYYKAQTDIPVLTWNGLNVEWKSIEPTLMYSILSLPLELDEAKDYVNGMHDQDSPPFDAYIFERQLRFAELGVMAADVAKRLRDTTGMPARPLKGWNPESVLRDRLKELSERLGKTNSIDGPDKADLV